ncbi:MAG: hypothetical protein ACXVCO_13740, partial [Ktedonobacterales bacterium]
RRDNHCPECGHDPEDYLTVHKLTKDCMPNVGDRVWFWRDDSKRWVIEKMTKSIAGWIGKNFLAYTHWCALVEPPIPE